MKNPALLAASLILVGGSAVACGGGAPTDASKDEFCKAQNSLFEGLDLTDPANLPSGEEWAKASHDWAEEMEKVGTPEDISDDARTGFENAIDEAKDVEAEDFSEENVEKKLEELEGEDADKEDKAFGQYVSETCGAPEMGETPSN